MNNDSWMWLQEQSIKISVVAFCLFVLDFASFVQDMRARRKLRQAHWLSGKEKYSNE